MIKREKFYKQIRIVQFEASKGIIGWEILFYYTFEYLSGERNFQEEWNFETRYTDVLYTQPRIRVGYVRAVDIAHGAPFVLKRYVTGGWGHLLRSRTLVPSLSTPHLSFTRSPCTCTYTSSSSSSVQSENCEPTIIREATRLKSQPRTELRRSAASVTTRLDDARQFLPLWKFYDLNLLNTLSPTFREF